MNDLISVKGSPKAG